VSVLLRVEGKQEVAALCEDLAKVALEWVQFYGTWDEDGGNLAIDPSDIFYCARALIDKLEAGYIEHA
jgi:hypothetical protein